MQHMMLCLQMSKTGCCQIHLILRVSWHVIAWFRELYKRTSFFKLTLSQFITLLVMHKPFRNISQDMWNHDIFCVTSDWCKLIHETWYGEHYFLGLSHTKDILCGERKQLKSAPSYIFSSRTFWEPFKTLLWNTTTVSLQRSLYRTNNDKQTGSRLLEWK